MNLTDWDLVSIFKDSVSKWYLVSNIRLQIEIDRYRYTDTDTDTDISVSVREYSNRYRYPPTLPYRTDIWYRYIGMITIPGSYRYSYRYYIKKSVWYRVTDTDMPQPISIPIPISKYSPYRTDNRYRVHTDIFHTNTDTGYRYLVSLSVSV